jgi:L-ribulose-5-phosphate 4-epimerase
VAGDYEWETGLAIAALFKPKGDGSPVYDPGETQMVLVGGHGPFAWGERASKAVYNGAVLEEIARMALYTLSLDPLSSPLPGYIVEKHYRRKHGSDAYYGQGSFSK